MKTVIITFHKTNSRDFRLFCCLACRCSIASTLVWLWLLVKNGQSFYDIINRFNVYQQRSVISLTSNTENWRYSVLSFPCHRFMGKRLEGRTQRNFNRFLSIDEQTYNLNTCYNQHWHKKYAESFPFIETTFMCVYSTFDVRNGWSSG